MRLIVESPAPDLNESLAITILWALDAPPGKRMDCVRLKT